MKIVHLQHAEGKISKTQMSGCFLISEKRNNFKGPDKGSILKVNIVTSASKHILFGIQWNCLDVEIPLSSQHICLGAKKILKIQ